MRFNHALLIGKSLKLKEIETPERGFLRDFTRRVSLEVVQHNKLLPLSVSLST